MVCAMVRDGVESLIVAAMVEGTVTSRASRSLNLVSSALQHLGVGTEFPQKHLSEVLDVVHSMAFLTAVSRSSTSSCETNRLCLETLRRSSQCVTGLVISGPSRSHSAQEDPEVYESRGSAMQSASSKEVCACWCDGVGDWTVDVDTSDL